MAVPVATAAPVIVGAAQVGVILIAVPGTYTGSFTGFARQWYCDYGAGAGWEAVAGATGRNFAPGAAEAGHPIRLGEIAVNAEGMSAENLSAATAEISVDPFETAADILLSAYSGPLGGWVRNRAADTATVSITAATGRARSNSTTSSTMYRLVTLPQAITTADYFSEGDIYFSAATMGGVAVRSVATGRSAYIFWYDTGTSPGLKISRTDINGAVVYSVGAVVPFTPTIGSTHRLRLQAEGTGATVALKAWLDGVLIIDTTDSDAARITTQGFPAAYFTRQGAEFTRFVAGPINAPASSTGIANLAPDGCWTWYNSPNCVEKDGIVYTGAIDSTGKVNITKNDAGVITTATFGTTIGADDHDNPALVVMPTGRLLVIYSQHPGDLVCRLSTNPLPDAINFGPVVTIYTTATSADKNSYANACLMPDGYVRIFARRGPGGVGTNPTRLFKKLASEIEAGDATWAAPVDQWGVATARPYTKYHFDTATGRIDVFASADHPNEGNTPLFHWYIMCAGGTETFHESDGTQIGAALPFDPTLTTTLVQDNSAGNNWTWDIKRFADGMIYAASTKYPGRTGVIPRGTVFTDIEYWLHRYSGGAWSSFRLSTGQVSLYDQENCYAGGVQIDGADPTIVYASERVGAVNEINQYRIEWAAVPTKTLMRAITSGSATNQNRPYSMPGHGLRQAVSWWDGTYNSWTSFATRTRTAAVGTDAFDTSPAGVTGAGGGAIGDIGGGGTGDVPVQGVGSGGIGAVTGGGTGEQTIPPITDTGAIIATLDRTVQPTPIPSGTSAASLLAVSAYGWSAPFDPADRTPFAIDWSRLLEEAETIEQIDRIRMSAEGAALGIQVDASVGRTPIISTDGRMTQFWFVCDSDFQSDAAFLGAGVNVGLSVLIRTSSVPYKQYERTAVLTVRQQ